MFEYQHCINCDEDLWYGEIDDYLGVELQGVGIICKSCERQGVESGEYVLTNIKPPNHLTFVLSALPYVKAKERRLLTTSWQKVVETVGTEQNGFDIAILEEDLSCHGDYVRKSLLRGKPSREEDFMNDPTFLQRAYDAGAFNLRIFLNSADKAGVPLRWLENPSFEKYEDAITNITFRMMNGTIFIASCCSPSPIVPGEGLKSLYYHPNQALKWLANIKEAKEAWMDLDVIKPEQYELVKVGKKRR